MDASADVLADIAAYPGDTVIVDAKTPDLSLNSEKPPPKRKRPWCEEEHNLLIQFYNEKIEDERDAVNTSTWTDLDKQAVLYLAARGYERSHVACGSHWAIIQRDQGLVHSGYDMFPTDMDTATDHSSGLTGVGTDDEAAMGTATTSRPKFVPWGDEEQRILADLIKRQRNVDLEGQDRTLTYQGFWRLMGSQLKGHGFDRTLWQARDFWYKTGREKFRFDERVRKAEIHDGSKSKSNGNGFRSMSQSGKVEIDDEFLINPQEDRLPISTWRHASRKRYTPSQSEELHKIFHENPDPPDEILEYLANKFDSPHIKVKTWFRNRRDAAKRQRRQYSDQDSPENIEHKRHDGKCSGRKHLRKDIYDPDFDNADDEATLVKKARVEKHGTAPKTPTERPKAPQPPQLQVNPSNGNIIRKVRPRDPSAIYTGADSTVEIAREKAYASPSSSTHPDRFTDQAVTDPKDDITSFKSSATTLLQAIESNIQTCEFQKQERMMCLQSIKSQRTSSLNEIESLGRRHEQQRVKLLEDLELKQRNERESMTKKIGDLEKQKHKEEKQLQEIQDRIEKDIEGKARLEGVLSYNY